jgi:hypothetical protein
MQKRSLPENVSLSCLDEDPSPSVEQQGMAGMQKRSLPENVSLSCLDEDP